MQNFHLLQNGELTGETVYLPDSSLNYENNSPLGYVAPSWFCFVEYHYAVQISKRLSPTGSGLQNRTAFLCVLLSVYFPFHHFSEASPREAAHR